MKFAATSATYARFMLAGEGAGTPKRLRYSSKTVCISVSVIVGVIVVLADFGLSRAALHYDESEKGHYAFACGHSVSNFRPDLSDWIAWTANTNLVSV